MLKKEEVTNLINKIKSGEISKAEALANITQLQPETANYLSDISRETTYQAADPYIRDHLVNGKSVLLGVTYCSLVLAAAKQLAPNSTLQLKKILFESVVDFEHTPTATIKVEINQQANEAAFECFATGITDKKAYRCASGRLAFSNSVAMPALDLSVFDKLKSQPGHKIYRNQDKVKHGPSLHTIQHFKRQGSEGLALLKLTDVMAQETHNYGGIHPALLDAAITSALAGRIDKAYIPFFIKGLHVYKNPGQACYCYAKHVQATEELQAADIWLCNEHGDVFAFIEGFTCKRLPEDKPAVAAKAKTTQTQPAIVQQSSLVKAIQTYLVDKLKSLNPDIESTAVQQNFLDLGIASNQLVQLTANLTQELAIELYPTLFFEYPNIQALADYFASQYAEVLQAKLGLNNSTKLSVAPDRQPVISQETKPDFDSSDEFEKTLLNQASSSSLPDAAVFANYSGPATRKEIAIIGMQGVFAESSNVEEFWENLRTGRNLIKEVPKDHWDVEPWFSTDKNAKNKTYCKWGSFIDDVDKFDAAFFNISPREAELMDPQLRYLLQTMYRTAEDAGYITKIKGTNTGVFTGVCFLDYAATLLEDQYGADPYLGTGNSNTMYSNRPSFTFNLTGPSISVDTACSSSLTALHYACSALRNNECDMAFVNGVNLLLGSYHYRYFSSLRALSATGRCHTFDERADGYVPGEAIASVLLKPLDKALADGDMIYGVIKGSAVKHGGYTPSITAPSVDGEMNTILAAWEDAGIDPETLGYIEAHGTGTKLGDPIEVQALTKAFDKYTDKKEFCVIGSAKAHIGHTEGAAGLVGVIKAVLSIKHQTIPALPQFEKLNPYTKLANTALTIAQQTQDWNAFGSPRRAGISSFGFGGAYAHVVIEEGPERAVKAYADKPYYLITLSAKQESVLKQRIVDLQVWLDKHQDDNNLHIEAISYTLNAGRSHFAWRCALVVASVDELHDKLGQLQKQSKAADCYVGKAGKEAEDKAIYERVLKNTLAELSAQSFQDLDDYKKQLEALANLYVKGYELDWQLLHQGEAQQKLSLPTYPFLKERYWVAALPAVSTHSRAVLHPLVGENISTLTGPVYKTLLASSDFYLTDHVIGDNKLLPGVAYLEMARAAGALAQPGVPVQGFNNVVWLQPMVVSANETVSIQLKSQGERVIYEISSQEGSVVHSQGELVYGQALDSGQLDVAGLTSRFSNVIGAEILYPRFKSRGFNYGSSFQALKWLRTDGEQALGYLVLPQVIKEAVDRQAYGLHPSLLDGALQAVMGLEAESAQQYLPFAIDKVELIGSLPDSCYVHVLKQVRQGQVQRYDIEVSDEQGKVVVRLKGFSVRVLTQAAATATLPLSSSTLAFYQPSWQNVPAKAATKQINQLLVIGANEHQSKSLQTKLNCPIITKAPEDIVIEQLPLELSHIVYVNSTDKADEDVLILFKLTQALIQSKRYKGINLVYVISQHGKLPYGSTLNGLVKTVRLEHPQYKYKVVQLDADTTLHNWADRVSIELQLDTQNEKVIRYEGEVRYVEQLIAFAPQLLSKTQLPLRQHGVYLITGGLGGLGLIFAEYLAKQYQAKLILMGRSALSATKQTALSNLEALGSEVIYLTADVTDEQNVKAVIEQAKAKFGHIHGIIHSAGLVKDSLLLKKSREDFKAVLAPKVQGTVNIDKATADEALDFIVLFSSMASVLGNVGQCDYAASNAFMDSFAVWRNSQVEQGKRLGKTIAINWPLWAEGGMQIDAASEAYLKQSLGMALLPTEPGIKAFEQILQYNSVQALIVYGDKRQLDNILLTQAVMGEITLATESAPAVPLIDSLAIRSQLEQTLIEVISQVLKVKPEQLDSEEDLSNYGFDSVSFTQLATQLNQTLNLNLSPAIMFEYSTLGQFAEYLMSAYPEVLTMHYQPKAHVSADTAIAASQARPMEKVPQIDITPSAPLEFAKPVSHDIAIIGMQGRLPGSNSLDEFWQHLVEGADLIREVPAQRWDYQAYEKAGVSKWGGFIEDIDKFDASFFNISPKEAELMDPQQRLFLQVVWQAIEDAGYAVQDLAAQKTGLFVGASSQDYAELLQGIQEAQVPTGLAHSLLANRISYLLNLTGPSEAVDSACSSSLLALHHAVRALQTGDCEIAIVGGVNALLTPSLSISFTKAGMLSPDGRCKTFDKRANGYVRGEGIGAIVLKPLSRAQADGDSIYAIIKGSSVNHGGHVNTLTAPNPNAQAELIIDACRRGHISPESISYIEAHGTGTGLGDPIEVNGLKKAFQTLAKEQNMRLAEQSCGLGSVKANIGHLEAAAGMAGIIKVLLMMKHRQLPKQVHFETCNPYIELDGSPFYIVDKTQPWEIKTEMKRRAGISSFGFGGANAHVILEEAPEQINPIHANKSYYLVTLSAKREETLKQRLADLQNWLLEHKDEDGLDLEDISYTLNTGRSHFAWRCALVVTSLTELEEKVKTLQQQNKVTGCYIGNASQEPEDKAIYASVLKTTLIELKEQAYQNLADYKKQLEALANLYVKGYDPDWQLLHQGESRQKLRLPTYPFMKKRHWYNSYVSEQAVPATPEQIPASKQIVLNENSHPLSEEILSKLPIEFLPEGIALIRLEDKANKNQLSSELIEALSVRFTQAVENEQIKVVVITGYDNVFCLGGNREGLLKIVNNDIGCDEVSTVCQQVLECPLPVIAAIQGHAFGVGLTFGLAADIIMMSENHTYSANFMRYGFTPGAGTTLILKEKFSERIATEMIWTAKEYTGKELKDKGANVLFQSGDKVLSEALMLAKSLAEKSLPALKVYKHELARSILERFPQTVKQERDMHREIFKEPEALARVQTHFAKLDSYNEQAETANAAEPVAVIAQPPQLKRTVSQPEAAEMPALQPIKASSIPQYTLEGITEELLTTISELLHIPVAELDKQAKFIELGVDSISAIDFIRKLSQRFELTLEAAKLYDYPTIDKLAHFIYEQVKHRVKAGQPAPELTIPALGPLTVVKPSLISLRAINTPIKSVSESIKAEVSLPINIPVVPDNLPTANNVVEIAIIGIAGSTPGAKGLDDFWQVLKEGKNVVNEISSERWSIADVYQPGNAQPNKTYSKWAGLLAEVDKFDSLFFNISPQEAMQMDPQQRLFLQASWQAFEDAGLNQQQLQGKNCGVFVGVGPGDYQFLMQQQSDGLSAYSLLGNSQSILAARIAYLLDLTGPNIAIDTACSSSLVAVHEACKSIIQGECEMALAGGVCVLNTPNMHIMTSQAGMLSAEGKCKTFDNTADGFVPAEGVGVIVLKRLDKALADGDRIHAVIKGSGVNQDGATNGITAPSARSQEQLVKQVYEKYHINPSDISYVEAHGTGTKLGDPIEVSALSSVFKHYTDKRNNCAIGSVKSNMGHALTAAGITGLIKTVLMLKHKKLVPTINFATPNEHIDFANSPFYVNTEYKDWTLGTAKRRLAALSSFGFSGTNAHMVLEEAPLPITSNYVDKPYYLFALSAKQETVLKQRLDDLQVWLTHCKDDHSLHLEAISYTLNAGRSHFGWRCALVVSSLEELKEKLKALQQSIKVAGCYIGNANPEPENKAIYRQVLEISLEKLKSPELLSQSGKYQETLEALANLYVKGYEIDWQLLHQGEAKQKISLPTYPFLKESHWVESSSVPSSYANNKPIVLHPLVGVNTSTLAIQSYKTMLEGTRFYLSDHVVGELKLLPGVAYLEMARVAGELAQPENKVTGFKRVVWLQPLVVSDKQQVSIKLIPNKDESVTYEISSREGAVIHSQGELVYGQARRSEPLAIEQLKQQLGQVLEANSLYAQLKAQGFSHGPSFQSVQWLRTDGEQVLGYLVLPKGVKEAVDRSQYVMHPSLLDGALQAVIGLQSASDKPNGQYLPFAIDEVELSGALPDSCYVWARKQADKGQVQRYDILVVDAQGEVLVTLKGFSARVLAQSSPTVKSPLLQSTLVYYQPSWHAQAVLEKKPVSQVLAIGVSSEQKKALQVELQCDVIQQTEIYDYAELIEQLPNELSHIVYVAKRASEAAQTIFALTQGLMQSKRYKGIKLVYITFPSDELPYSAMVKGLAKSIVLEHSQYKYKVIQLTDNDTKAWVSKVSAELRSGFNEDKIVRYEDGVRYVERLTTIKQLSNKALPLRRQGVYLITGGLGGLGLLFAEYLAKNYQAKLVLIGRSALDAKKAAILAKLKDLGSEVLYLTGDVANEDDIKVIIRQTKAKFTVIHGLIHSAGIIKDNLIVKKSLEDFQQVIAPKVQGTVNIDQATAHEALDFVVLFSSIASMVGNAGQCDYASGNAFMDAFAVWRNTQVEQGKRFGKTLSINWPLWAEGGMQVNEANELYFRQTLGMEALPVEHGLRAFEQLLQDNLAQALVIYGNKEQLDKSFLAQARVANDSIATLSDTLAAAADRSAIGAKLEQTLTIAISKILKIKPEQLDRTQDLTSYGLDSISFTSLVNQLNQMLELRLTPVIMFEHSTLEQLGAYLLAEYPAQLLAYYQPELQAELNQAPVIDSPFLLADKPLKQADNERAAALRQSLLPVLAVSEIKAGLDTVYPLSLGQKQLYAIYAIDQQATQYNTGMALELRGQIDKAALEQAINVIISRHDVLRTYFQLNEQGEPQAILQKDLRIELILRKMQHVSTKHYQQHSRQQIEHCHKVPFDLAKAPLFRWDLIQYSKRHHVLIFVIHHILVDGWCFNLILKELMDYYNGRALGKNETLVPVKYTYQDFVAWQQINLSEERKQVISQFWEAQFSSMPEPLNFGKGFTVKEESKRKKMALTLPKPLTQSLRALTKVHNVQLFSCLLSAYQVLLMRYTQQADIVIGVPFFGREADFVETIGYFINVLPLRAQLSASLTFAHLVEQNQALFNQVKLHQLLSIPQLLSRLKVDRAQGTQPLFQVLFNYLPSMDSAIKLAGLQADLIWADEGETDYALNMMIIDKGDELEVTFNYDANLFDDRFIKQMLKHYKQLIQSMTISTEQAIGFINFLSPAERKKLLIDWNQTEVPYPHDKTIHQLFEEQVKKTPNNIAVIFEGQQLTYRELNKRANQLAYHLISLGVKPDNLVAICLNRSFAFIIGVLGILKAGGAYVPLDPNYPKDRLQFMLQDTKAAVLLTQQAYLSQYDDFIGQFVVLDETEALAHYPIKDPVVPVLSRHLAYVIYTSGSTGQPKGVMVEHRNISRLVKNTNYVDFQEHDAVAQVSNVSFDAATFEIWGALLNGARLVAITNEVLLSAEKLQQAIQHYQLTVMFVTAALCDQLVNQNNKVFAGLKCLLAGGDALTPSTMATLQADIKTRPGKIVNGYGPTEATTFAVTYNIPSNYSAVHSIPIGRPIANTQLYILDSHRHPVPIGVLGELYIGGTGVARGYLNRSELTQERFIENPFATETDKTQGINLKLYKTGDLVRYMADGNIEYLGRVDFQVKIRGFRIELGEIESLLRQQAAIQDVAVIAREDEPGDKRLVAYVVPKAMLAEAAQADFIQELKIHLSQHLPNYMMPSYYVLLEQLPLNINGKLDRKALPKPEILYRAEGSFVAPATLAEQQLATVWAELLKLKPNTISREDDFFMLGGNSLLAVQMVTQASRLFGKPVPLKSLLAAPILRRLADVITDDAANAKLASGALSTQVLLADVVLDKTIQAQTKPATVIPRAIFLTGVTGFVGAFLLRDLLQAYPEAVIYCLVRGKTQQEGKQRIQDNLQRYGLWQDNITARIKPVLGDLASPYLGLSSQQFQQLSQEIDVIYHNGALVNFTYDYSQLKAPNVLGTHEVLKLASYSKPKIVHYVSTLSVFPDANNRRWLESDTLEWDADLTAGYAQTKWVAEKMVLAARARGLITHIYRLGRVTGHSHNGVWNTDDFMCRFIKGCIQLGKAPMTGMLVDFTPVDYVSHAIVHLAHPNTQLPENQTFHLIHPQAIGSHELINYILKTGYSLQQVSYDEWQNALYKAVEAKQENALTSLLPTIEIGKDIMAAKHIIFDSSHAKKVLKNTKIRCPDTVSKLLPLYLDYFIKSGFLQAPGIKKKISRKRQSKVLNSPIALES
jgi:amino acid adenylation domain-containing protein/thioester reductase-like protein